MRRFIVLGLLVTSCVPAQTAPDSTTTSTTAVVTTTSLLAETSTTTSSAVSTTVPSPGSVLVLGDWGSGTADEKAVAVAMADFAEANPIHAVLTTGDNFYSDDAELLLEPMHWISDQGIEFWISWGNHDVETSRRVQVVEEAFGSPPRWTVHDWGEVDVVILDSNQVSSADQLEFLTETMEGSDDPAIVVFHHPPLSCSSHGDTLSVLQNWVPRFDDDVVLILSGHDHNYQRFEDSGISYVVSGGGGQTLYELTSCPADHPERLAGEMVHHFLVLAQDEEKILVGAVDVNGRTIDSFVVPLGGGE